MEIKSRPGSVVAAMIGAAAVTAQFVSGKAVRDALFLTSLDLSALPAMLVATSVCSILLVVTNARAARTIGPATLVPASFAVSGVLFLIEWVLRPQAPSSTAIVVYLHISGLGPVLASGFWLIASERFDPRTAKRRYGHIAAAGTLGGLVSALVTERVAAAFGVPAMFPLLAILQFGSAWFVRRTAVCAVAGGTPASTGEPPSAAQSRSPLRVLSEAPYLRNLAALVLLGTTGAALVDYLFKAQAIETFGRGDTLLRFFALYYAATSLMAFVLQTSASHLVLERFGLGVSAGTPAGALLAGSLAGLVAPGFGSLLAARGGESVFRSSFFRAGYELFYTPIPAEEKRAAKTLIDVGFDRLGDGVGGGFVRLSVLLAPAMQSSAILSLAIMCSAGALLAASRLNRGYLGTLENSLVDLSRRAGAIDPTQVEHTVSGTRSTGRLRRDRVGTSLGRQMDGAVARAAIDSPSLDAEMRDILSLRSRSRLRIVEVLSREDGLTAGLVPHAITLLAWDQVADHAMFALRKVAEERVGQLVDALLDPNQDFAVRRTNRRGRWSRSWRKTRGSRLTARGFSRSFSVRSPWAAACGKAGVCWTVPMQATATRRSTSSCGRARARASRTCSPCCRWSCRVSRCRWRFGASTPTTHTWRGRRSNTSKAFCPPPFGSGCGRSSSTGPRSVPRVRPSRSWPIFCARTIRSC
ncbi:MAG: hypothetical protein DMF96_17835 [Acidobacteria bacterium]|nr:MAG: hypothetical protein DMF96_17835 [Acidobacteriota bacterium]